jgi:hypothetical protein
MSQADRSSDYAEQKSQERRGGESVRVELYPLQGSGTGRGCYSQPMNMLPSVPPPTNTEIKWKLLEAAPATDYDRLIVKAPYETDRHFAVFYRESANRLAATFSGNSEDDMILLPYLGLYLQAYELAVKSFIRDLAKERRRLVDSGNPDLHPDKIEKRFSTLLDTICTSS